MDEHRISPCGDPFYAAGARCEHDHYGAPYRSEAADEKRDRDCFYCLGGMVFLGGLNEDGEEEYYGVYCRRCGGSGVLHAG